jgi:hypothetical protein
VVDHRGGVWQRLPVPGDRGDCHPRSMATPSMSGAELVGLPAPPAAHAGRAWDNGGEAWCDRILPGQAVPNQR